MRLLLILLICMAGCTFVRETHIDVKLKDGQYGMIRRIKGSGDSVYRARTAFSLFSRGK